MKTAVEWLEEKFNNYDINTGKAGFRMFLKQAKEMEKQQLIDFGQEIVNDIAYDSQDKEWVTDKYKETFKSE